MFRMHAERTIWLHIGHGKTGTTSLQGYFSQRSKVDPKIHYPTFGQMPSGAHHRFFPLKHQHKMHSVVPGLLTKLRKEIQKLPASTITVLSSEHMCYFEESQVQVLAKQLDGFDVRILYYIRRQDDLIDSTYRWKLEHGRSSLPPIDEIVQKWTDPFDFSQRLKPWRKYFKDSQITVRLYHPETVGRSIVSDACRAMGINELFIETASREQRKSINNFVVDILRTHDDIYPISEKREKFIADLKSLTKDWDPQLSKEFLSNEARREIMRRFAQSNSEVARDFLYERETNILLR